MQHMREWLMDSQQEAVLKKIAWRVVPLLTLAYVVNYLDRTNIGVASLTMNDDLGLTAKQYGFGAGIFFLGYTVFEIPSNLALYSVGARRWIARIMMTWGAVSIATAWVYDANSYYIARLALGVAEAGFFPGVAYYFAAWFPTQYRTRMLAWFLVAIPLSSVIGGPISGLLLEMNGVFGLEGWKWLFIVEGLPAVILGVVMLAVIQFGFTLGSYGIGVFLPQIIKGFGLTNLASSFLSAVPYVFASIAMLWWSWHVDRTGKKIGNLTVALVIGMIGLAASVTTGNLFLGLTALTVALVGITSARAIFWPIPTRFLSGVGAAAGLAFINSIGTIGGFAGPYLMGWLREHTGSFAAGLLAMAGVLLAAALVTSSLKLVIKSE